MRRVKKVKLPVIRVEPVSGAVKYVTQIVASQLAGSTAYPEMQPGPLIEDNVIPIVISGRAYFRLTVTPE